MKKSRGIVASFQNAFRGLRVLFREERNAQIHLLAVILVTAAGILLEISITEWLIILLFFGLVIGSEALNTSIEKLSDVVQPNSDKRIKIVKDLSAGAVLFSAICAMIAGILIFLPKIIHLIKTSV
jgi:diacylglycerol kinase